MSDSVKFCHKLSYIVKYCKYCQTSDLGLRLEVDFVFPLSQEQEQEQQQE